MEAMHSSRGFDAPTRSSLSRAAATLGFVGPRSSRTNSMRDIDLHPDANVRSSPFGSPGMVQRAKRGLNASLEEPTRKLQRAKDAAVALSAEVPSARKLRAVAREGVLSQAQSLQDAAAMAARVATDRATQASHAIEAFEDAADEQLKVVEDAVEAGVEQLQAHATSAMRSVHEQAVILEQAVEAGVNALQEKASTAVTGAIWGAMSYMAPRLKWSSLGALGLRAEPVAPVADRPRVRVPSFEEVQAQAEMLDAEGEASGMEQ